MRQGAIYEALLCKKKGLIKQSYFIYVVMGILITILTFYENLKEMSYKEDELAMALSELPSVN